MLANIRNSAQTRISASLSLHIAAVSPEKNDVSPDPEDPSMITRPMSIPSLFMAPG